jgi:meso-butanediol dehydrogenase/(S,S)-butanediol dehydrogenase/diacetyl reductase
MRPPASGRAQGQKWRRAPNETRAVKIAGVAIVTGGGSGLGAAIARRLAHDGTSVVVAGRRQEPLAQVAEELEAAGGHSLAVSTDVSNEESVTNLVSAAVDTYGGLDTVVSNAGVLVGAGKVTEMSPADWQTALNINVTGAFLLARHTIPHLAEGGGSIVTIGSVSSVMGGPISASYCASKSALLMLTQCLAVDHASDGVRANCVLPGWIETEMGDAEMDWIAEREGTDRAGAYALTNENVPMRRASKPEEVAEAVAFLASPAASYITGVALPVDGGSLAVWPGVTLYMEKNAPDTPQ